MWKKPNIETNIADECLPTREYTFYSYNFEYSNFLKKIVPSVLTCHLFMRHNWLSHNSLTDLLWYASQSLTLHLEPSSKSEKFKRQIGNTLHEQNIRCTVKNMFNRYRL